MWGEIGEVREILFDLVALSYTLTLAQLVEYCPVHQKIGGWFNSGQGTCLDCSHDPQ